MKTAQRSKNARNSAKHPKRFSGTARGGVPPSPPNEKASLWDAFLFTEMGSNPNAEGAESPLFYVHYFNLLFTVLQLEISITRIEVHCSLSVL